MEEEILQLKRSIENERKARLQLEDDLDLLSVDNERLRNICILNGYNTTTTAQTSNVNRCKSNYSQKEGNGLIHNGTGTFSSSSTFVNINENDQNFEWKDLLVDGDGICADTIHTKIANACGGMNALCLSFCSYPGENINESSVRLVMN